MPAFAGNQDERRIGLQRAQRDGFFQDLFFDRLALAIVQVQLLRKLGCLCAIA